VVIVVTPFWFLLPIKDHTMAAAPPVPPRRLKEFGSLRHVRGRDP